MKIFISEVKKETRKLLSGNYNAPVLTIFIPFLISVAIVLKNFRGGDFYEIFNKMSSVNGNIIILLINLFMSLAGIAVIYGIKTLHMGEQPHLLKSYTVAIFNINKYLPTFFLVTALPSALSSLMSPENMDWLYDVVLMLYVDYTAYLFMIQLLRVVLNVIQIYLSISLMFVPCILVETRQFSGFSVIAESFRLSRGRKWQLFLMCLGFSGWYILGYAALIIGILWAVVYFNATLYIYYKKIAEDTTPILENEGEVDYGRN